MLSETNGHFLNRLQLPQFSLSDSDEKVIGFVESARNPQRICYSAIGARSNYVRHVKPCVLLIGILWFD